MDRSKTNLKKFHFIYRTTNLLNGRYYVGLHSTDNVNDDYIGSGTRFLNEVNKYGRENFKREIIEFLPSRKDLKARERSLVNEDMLKDPLCLNLKLGGEGGWDHLPAEIVRANAIANSGFTNPSANGFERIQEGRSRGGKIAGKMVGAATVKFATLAAASQSACEKRRQTMNERGHMQGEKNSQFGTCWVTNGVKPIKIKKEELDEYLMNGYRRGRNAGVV